MPQTSQHTALHTLATDLPAMDYWPAIAADAWTQLHRPAQAYISRYALGRDYHKVLRKRLQTLATRIEQRIGPFGYRVFTDSAPVLEKPLARNAGLGWIGKHTNLIHRSAGSWFFLGEIYTDLPLPTTRPTPDSHCGRCTACIDACPTGAITAPYQLDARRCISYLTIELREAIPEPLRPLIGNRIYGCDDCQLVCPWNRFARPTPEVDFLPRHGLDHASLIELFYWDEVIFLARTAGSALRRIGSGSAPLAPWMIEVFGREYGKEIVNFYGSNEGICLFATPETAPEPEVRAAMFRRPKAGALIQSRVVNTDSGDEIVRPGEAGELLIAGPTVFKGYFEHDNSGLFTRDGYFRTGDLVEICGEDGSYYRIVGRCKDIINRGGMKVSPAELDIALDKHPCLAEAAVCAYADERLGEKICACLVPVEGQELPALAELQSWLLEQGLAKFKLPERIEEFTQLPRNPLGKVQRFTLQDEVAGRKEIKT